MNSDKNYCLDNENVDDSFDRIYDNFGAFLYSTKEYKKLPKKLKISPNDYLANYKHTTFVVSCVEEYINIVLTLQKIVQSTLYDAQIIYRGQANYEWDLAPSLWRLTNSDDTTEHMLVSEFIHQNPNDFLGIESDFDLLAKMQHYGLPTRLLDFTYNPLVALYFACENNIKSTARILISTFTENNNGNVVDAICGTWKFYGIDNLGVEEFLRKKDVSLWFFIHSLFGYKGANLFKRPKYWNQRLKNQSAIFMVYPDTVYDRYSERLRNINRGFTELLDDKTEYKFAFLSNYELRFKNFMDSKSPTFSYEDCFLNFKSWLNIKNSYIRDGENVLFDNNSELSQFGYDNGLSEIGMSVLSDRFKLSYEEAPLSQETIESKFCSILIPQKFKVRILNELASLGVDVGFVYPELEYSAKNIKAKFI